MVTDEVKKYKSYVIYGAQVIAVGTSVAIEKLTGMRPQSFAVGKTKDKATYPLGNPKEIDGIPVVAIETIATDTFIVVGVTELIQREVLPYLSEHGYQNVYPLTQHEEHLLMSEYYNSIRMFPTIYANDRSADAMLDNRAIDAGQADGVNFTLYEVMNDKDKPLNFHPELHYYEKPIQAGAALTERTIAELRDSTGINISMKNRMYCEMSAVYWIWKNTNHDWIGIEHYRRHLLVKPEMLMDDIDVIMPLPYVCYPHEMAQFLRFTTTNVLDALLRALNELHSDKYEAYRNILYGKYQYTYNLVCARKNVFDHYCQWFFEITEYMEKNMCTDVPELIETRAFSYVAEVLTNLYFMYHQKDLRIRHVEKEIYT